MEKGGVLITVELLRSLNIEPEQHIYLYIPSISFGSFLQAHPFHVISYDGDKKTMQLIVEPRRGLTAKFERADESEKRLVAFSGPYGPTMDVTRISKLLMIPDGYGIAAMLPYLHELISGHTTKQVRP